MKTVTVVAVVCVLGWTGCARSGPPAETGAAGTGAAGSATTVMAKAERFVNELCACAENDSACAEAVGKKVSAELSETEIEALEREMTGSALEKKLEGCVERLRPKRNMKAEAALQLNRMGKNAKRTYAEISSFVVGTAAALPRKPGSSGCCGGGSTLCKADPASFAADLIWRALDFQIDEDSLFYYEYTGTATTFTAKATGDLDCDGTEIVYTLTGTAADGNPTTHLTEPAPNAD
jgi:hypothetical protein